MRGTRIRYGRRTFEVTALTGQTRGDRAGRLDCGAVGYCQPLYTARRRVKCAMVPGSGEHRERRESRLQAGLLQSSLTSSCDTPKSCQSTQACPVNLRCISTVAARRASTRCFPKGRCLCFVIQDGDSVDLFTAQRRRCDFNQSPRVSQNLVQMRVAAAARTAVSG